MAFRQYRNNRQTELSPDEMLSRMEQFCAYRERCPKEVREKLAQLGASGETAEQIYEVLKNDRYFDEMRFALAFAGGKFRINHWGRVRIRLELRQREISAAAIKAALESINPEEYEDCLLRLAEKKLGQYGTDDKRYDLISASLIRSGFEPELVFKTVNRFR